jgi:dTMP kinase
MPRGLFITLEGLDGSGKTTQIRRLASWLKSRYPSEDEKQPVLTRQPGGTETGDRIRTLVLDSRSTALDPMTEMALMFADRAQAIAEVIQPALDAGKIVLCDRFTDSTLVYQGCGRGLDPAIVLDLDRIACQGLRPATTILIDIDLETSLNRAKRRNERFGPSESRIDDESAAFHDSVRKGYLALAAAEPARFLVIDGRAPIGDVARQIREALQNRV